MKGISPWAMAAENTLTKEELPVLFEKKIKDFDFHVLLSDDSLYIKANWPDGSISFRAAYAPDGQLELQKKQLISNGIELSLTSSIGVQTVQIEWLMGNYPILHFTNSLKPIADLHFPFWPRDIIIHNSTKKMQATGEVYVQQVGTRSGLLHFALKKPAVGTLLYFQNLTSLADYCEQTETSAGEVVGGIWPEIGFALPPTKDKPLQAQKEVVISDAFIAFDTQIVKEEHTLTKQYLEMLAAIYLQLPKPETTYHHWPDILENGLKDLIDSPGCWVQVEGNQYFNAYVSDYETPPEIMVQLAVLLPLLDYVEWSGKTLEVMKVIKAGLPAFFDPKLKTIVRWLPAAEDQLKGEEEQKKPMVMDSWYLHHPLLNLSRLALKGDKVATQLFLDSLGYAIKVARNFKYKWPVFYKMDTLEVLKDETKPGEFGEKDVAGLYTHVMLQAWELTKEKKYLDEAKKAANTLVGLGFKLFYQANNTTFSAGALLRLYKETNDERYLNLSYLCIANIFQNVQLWDCNYGYGKHFPSFFALFPLSDAPYTAVYEEQEVFCALHDFLKHAEGLEILPAVNLLCSEYIRYLVNRAPFYYPPMLPKEMLSEEVKVGEVDPKLWIALEDLQDGWEKSGQVGQEVYGAGNAFGILPRHYTKVEAGNFMLYADYPITKFRIKKDHSLSFWLKGDERITCKVRVLPENKKQQFQLSIKGNQKEIEPIQTKEGHFEYHIKGNQSLQLKWKS
jgi:hypothetical protein